MHVRQNLISNETALLLADLDYGCASPEVFRAIVSPAERGGGLEHEPDFAERELQSIIEDMGHWRTGRTRRAGTVVMHECEPPEARRRMADYYRWFGVGQRARFQVVTISGFYEAWIYAYGTVAAENSFSDTDCIFDSHEVASTLDELHERLGLTEDVPQDLIEAYRAEFRRLLAGCGKRPSQIGCDTIQYPNWLGLGSATDAWSRPADRYDVQLPEPGGVGACAAPAAAHPAVGQRRSGASVAQV
jgi:hypothetical protein